MKNSFRLKLLATLALAATAVLISCSSQTYANKRKAEKAAMAAYVSSHNLQFSTDSAYMFSLPVPWPENMYFQTYRGCYIRLIEHDTTQLAVTDGVNVVLYYETYDLSDNLLYSNVETREGQHFIFSSGSTDPCTAWNDAAGCVRHGSVFDIIVDSQIGTTDQYNDVVTYRLHFFDTSVKR